MTPSEDTAPVADSRFLTDAIRPQMEPTPAAAPSLTPDDKAKRPFQGILKAVVDGSNTSYYVKLPYDVCCLSSDASEALHVRCNSSSKATRLERLVGLTRLLISYSVTEGAYLLTVGSFV